MVITAKSAARQRTRQQWLPWLSLTLAVVAFILDFRSGPAVPAEMLYILPPLLGFWSTTHRHSLLAGIAVTALSATAMVMRGDFSAAMLQDRGIGLLAVWITVVLCVVHHRDQRSIVAEKAIGGSYLDIADVLITVLDLDEEVVLLNPKGRQMLGVEPGEILGKGGVDRLFPEEARDEARRGLHALAGGDVSSWRIESKLRQRNGEVRIIEWHWAAPRDEQGAVLYLIGSGTDLTARREAEVALLGQAALTRLGEMALMVAHEVKNPLAGLRGVIQAIGDRLATDPEVPRVVKRACRSIDGLTELVDNLLVFARPGLPACTPLRVLPVLRDVALLLEKDPKLGSRPVTVGGDDAQITGDAGLLRQAFLNLMLNAAEASGPGRAIGVQLRSAGDGCSVEIHDDGPGIPLEIRGRVFEPFFSTKARGSGLGLAIAQRVVILHGGDIDVHCPPQGGTTMTVTLP